VPEPSLRRAGRCLASFFIPVWRTTTSRIRQNGLGAMNANSIYSANFAPGPPASVNIREMAWWLARHGHEVRVVVARRPKLSCVASRQKISMAAVVVATLSMCDDFGELPPLFQSPCGHANLDSTFSRLRLSSFPVMLCRSPGGRILFLRLTGVHVCSGGLVGRPGCVSPSDGCIMQDFEG